jgi:hypothetical protein
MTVNGARRLRCQEGEDFPSGVEPANGVGL